MTADIHIHDDNVEVTGGPLAVEGRIDAAGGMAVRGDDDQILVQLVEGSDDEHVELRLGERAQGSQPPRAQLTISSEEGVSHINGRRAFGFESISSQAVHGREGNFRTIELGGGEPNEGGGHDGLIVLRNDDGEETVTIDGASGDVVVATVGSLVEVIGELQSKVGELQGKVEDLQEQVEELGSGPGGGGPPGGGPPGLG